MKTSHICKDGYVLSYDRTKAVAYMDRARRAKKPVYEIRGPGFILLDLSADQVEIEHIFETKYQEATLWIVYHTGIRRCLKQKHFSVPLKGLADLRQVAGIIKNQQSKKRK